MFDGEKAEKVRMEDLDGILDGINNSNKDKKQNNLSIAKDKTKSSSIDADSNHLYQELELADNFFGNGGCDDGYYEEEGKANVIATHWSKQLEQYSSGQSLFDPNEDAPIDNPDV